MLRSIRWVCLITISRRRFNQSAHAVTKEMRRYGRCEWMTASSTNQRYFRWRSENNNNIESSGRKRSPALEFGKRKRQRNKSGSGRPCQTCLGYMGPSHDGENIIISQKLTKYRRWKYCKQCHLDNMPRVEATMVWHCRCQYVGLL